MTSNSCNEYTDNFNDHLQEIEDEELYGGFEEYGWSWDANDNGDFQILLWRGEFEDEIIIQQKNGSTDPDEKYKSKKFSLIKEINETWENSVLVYVKTETQITELVAYPTSRSRGKLYMRFGFEEDPNEENKMIFKVYP